MPRDTQGEWHVMREAQIGVNQPQAKECQGLLASATSQEKGMEGILPQSLQKNPTLPTPWFQTPNLQSCERKNFCCFKLSSLWCFGPHRKPALRVMSKPVISSTNVVRLQLCLVSWRPWRCLLVGKWLWCNIASIWSREKFSLSLPPSPLSLPSPTTSLLASSKFTHW